MDADDRLVWFDKLLIFIFCTVILSVYHYVNFYVINLSGLMFVIDVIIGLIVFCLLITIGDPIFEDFTFIDYQLIKIALSFLIILHGISLFTYSSNNYQVNLVIIGTLIFLTFILFILFITGSPTVDEIQMNAKNTKIKNEKIEHFKKVKLK